MTLPAGVAAAAPPQLLVVLEPTGKTRDGLPVLTRHRDGGRVAAVLARGFSGRLLRLYALEQAFLSRATGRAPEPAYLLLSNRQGGFPQFGFYLDGVKKADAGWVDLHRSSTLSGRFGAMDQIFPHELLHVIVRQLAGEPRESGGNQMHAIGVRTDPVNAFGEGFAEHVQVMSVDDPDAAPGDRRAPGRWRRARSRRTGVRRLRQGAGGPVPARSPVADAFPAVVQPERAGVAVPRGQGQPVCPHRRDSGPAARPIGQVPRVSVPERRARHADRSAEASGGHVVERGRHRPPVLAVRVRSRLAATVPRRPDVRGVRGDERGSVAARECLPEAVRGVGRGSAQLGRRAAPRLCPAVPRGRARGRTRGARSAARPGPPGCAGDLAGERRADDGHEPVRPVPRASAPTHVRRERGVGARLARGAGRHPRPGGAAARARAVRAHRRCPGRAGPGTGRDKPHRRDGEGHGRASRARGR